MCEHGYRLPDGNVIREDLGFSSSDFRFKVTKVPADGTAPEVSVTRYTGEDAHVIIPEEVFGCRVVSVGKAAFAGCGQVVSVTVPEGVRSIGEWAFYACSSLRDVNLPDGLESIRRCAFRSCHELTEFIVPDTTCEIRDWAFQCCYSLRKVRLPAALTEFDMKAFCRCGELESFEITGEGDHYMTDGGLLYDTDVHALVMCPEGRAGDVRIPEGIEWIRGAAFNRCSRVVSVHIPSTVDRIRAGTFVYCSSLECITVPAEPSKKLKADLKKCASSPILVRIAE